MKPKRRYYSLIDKVYQMNNLYEAWLSVKKNQGSGGIDGVSIAMYEKKVSMNLGELQRLLQQGRYKPDPVRRHFIEKENGKLRPLGIPTIRDRICQQAVRQKEQAEEAYLAAKTILEDELQLRMHPEKTKVVHFDEGFRFLGFDFWKDYLILPDAKVKKYKDKVRKITCRQQGNNLVDMVKMLNEVSRGFGNYFGIGNVKKRFERLDEWTRMRVRLSCVRRSLRFQTS